MKKVTFIIAVVLYGLYSTPLNAQSLVLKGGLNLSKLPIEDEELNYHEDDGFGGTYGMKTDVLLLPGFHIGADFEIPFTDQFSFTPGLYFSSRGLKLQGEAYYRYTDFETGIIESDEEEYSIAMRLYYLELPLTAKFQFEINRDWNAYVQAGGYAGYGLFGNVHMEFEDEEDSEEYEMENSERMDFGLTFGAGVEYDRMLIGLHYDLGMAENLESFEEPNRNLKISLGYRLF